MKISNDTVTFETSDFNELSPALRAAIEFCAGPTILPEDYLSKKLNDSLDEVLFIQKKKLLVQHEKTCVALVLADAVTQDQVKSILKVV